MRDANCIFCKILNGDIPSAKLYEDEDFAIILDVGPASLGHALIIPKEHYANVFEMPEELLAKAMSLAKVWGEKLVKGLNADGLREQLSIIQNKPQVEKKVRFWQKGRGKKKKDEKENNEQS